MRTIEKIMHYSRGNHVIKAEISLFMLFVCVVNNDVMLSICLYTQTTGIDGMGDRAIAV